MRCINILEKNELLFTSEKFRILAGDAYLQSGCISQAIQVLEKKIKDQEVFKLQNISSMSSSDLMIGSNSG